MVEVFAQSVSGTAPSAAMASAPAIAAAAAGGGTVWSFVIATVLALLVASCIARFTTRMAAPGGLYSLTAQGLGPGFAYIGAVALLVGYALLAASALAGAATYLTALPGDIAGVDPGRVGRVVAVVILGLVIALLVRRGVRLSARVVLMAESVSILLMLFVFVVLLLAGASPASPAPASPVTGGASGVLAGVLPALAAFIGFEIATSLGAEAQRPFRTVPRAVWWTVAVTGVLYVFAAQVQVLGFAGTPGGLAAQDEPIRVLAADQGWRWLSLAIDTGLVMSFFACGLAAMTALVRVLFSLARDSVAPAALGRTHPRYRTPYVAVAVATPLVVVAPVLAAGRGYPLGSTLALFLTSATCGFLVAYVLVCVAAPAFLRRIGELTWVAVGVSAVIVPILLAVLVAFLATRPLPALVVGVAGLLGISGYAWLRLCRPGALAAIGVYDETVAADVLLPPGRAA
jgi:amino acid transporter